MWGKWRWSLSQWPKEGFRAGKQLCGIVLAAVGTGDAVLPSAMPHRKDAKENREEWKPPSFSQAGWGQGHLQRPDCLWPPKGSPESPCPHASLSLGELGSKRWCYTEKPQSGKGEGTVQKPQVLYCSLQRPAGHSGWGDACLAGSPSAGHRRVENRGDAEKGVRFARTCCSGSPGPFSPNSRAVACSASSCRRPHTPFMQPAGTQGLPVATLSPERMPTARPDLAEKSSALFRSDLHPGDAAALSKAAAD